MTQRSLYIGTYTRPAPYLERAEGGGIHVASYDDDTGAVSLQQVVDGIENPSYMALAPDGRTLHAIWEVLDWQSGLVSTFHRNPDDGQLTYANVQSTVGALPCYVSLPASGSFALIANYLSGSVTVFPRREDGTLAEASQVLQHSGTGPDPDRQEGPHAHCIVLDPAARYAFSADLGADAVFGYAVTEDGSGLREHVRLPMPAGSGPRHLVFHPDAMAAYAINELASTITTLRYDAANGMLEVSGSMPTLPEDFSGDSHCADVQVHPTGRFVYGSNRGHDSIAIFGVDPTSGGLEPLGFRSTEGRTPRNFAIDPAGRFLLVANQDSDSIVSLPIDPDSGALGETASVTEVPNPNCLKFAS